MAKLQLIFSPENLHLCLARLGTFGAFAPGAYSNSLEFELTPCAVEAHNMQRELLAIALDLKIYCIACTACIGSENFPQRGRETPRGDAKAYFF